jgi:glucuronate isomerase
VFTTNEVFDDLDTFVKIKEKNYGFTVLPAFRADKIMNIEAAPYLTFLGKLEELTHKINNIDDLESALEKRLQAFLTVGCRASDIAVENVYAVPTKESADAVLKSVLAGGKPSESDAETFKGYVTYFLMKLYAKYKVATELHFGAMRNNNTVMLNKLGLDTGFDSISDKNSISQLSRLMDKLNSEGALPKLIIFNLNPKMNSEIMTIIGCFQSSEARGKIQYGPAWWFLDNKVGMEKHLEDLTATGHIGAFVGMLTDSRSLLSYPRHHYFRRILCTYLGTLIEKGEMTSNFDLVGSVIKDICYNNAIKYFNV